MISIPTNDVVIQTKKENKQDVCYLTDNNFYFKKSYKFKSTYFSKNGTDITKDKKIWENWNLNRGIIKLNWDINSGALYFEFSFVDKKAIENISFKINNNKTFNIKPNFSYVDDLYSFKILANDVFGQNFNFLNLETLQMSLSNSTGSKNLNFVFEPFNINKNDFMLHDSIYKLSFQNGLSINGENVIDYFATTSFQPYSLKQGVWNQNIIKIINDEDKVFKRNKLELISLEGVPISSNSKTNFEISLDKREDFYDVCVNQNTYYDLERKETQKGIGLNSNSGYIIPFEFSGNMFLTLKIKINNIPFSISWMQQIEKPYFKNNQGIKKIHLQTNNKAVDEKSLISIDADDLEIIDKYNFTFDEFVEWLKNKNS